MKVLVVTKNLNNLDQYIKDGVKGFIFGLKDFSINYPELTINEIEALVNKYKGQDIFVSINKTIFNSELNTLEEVMLRLNSINIKGILFYDLSILSIYHKYKFNYSLVWHQTHMVTNYNTCNFYYDKGVKYALLASEITKDEMIEISNNSKVKTMVNLVLHPVIAHSKRKLLTNYYSSINESYDGNDKIIKELDNDYIIKENKDGTCILEGHIINGINYALELSRHSICYGILNDTNIDEELFSKIVNLSCDVINNRNLDSLHKLNNLIGTNSGFFNKKTIFKVKKDEKKD